MELQSEELNTIYIVLQKKPKVGLEVRTLVCFDAKLNNIKSKI